MFVGRKKELEYLSENYKKEGSNILVLYGHKGVGKTSLMFRFASDKDAAYYMAKPCSEEEQLSLWNDECNMRFQKEDLTYLRILSSLQWKTNGKRVLIIDEFQNAVKYSDSFMSSLIKFVKDSKEEYLVLLCSSSISFIENSLVSKIGGLALGISGFFKVPQLKFIDCVSYFDHFSTVDCMEIYSILGGMPGYWAKISDRISVRENIERCILHPDAALHEEGLRIVSEELRELNVYCTLLSCMANGMTKLNDLHVHTGYSRAKISVYIKNLMEREIVEKVFSFDQASSLNAKKGVYRISNRYLFFYFKFIFRNESRLHLLGPKKFYEAYVENEILAFHQENLKFICGEYLDILNQKNMLPIKSVRTGEWVGKDGVIDIVMQNEEWDNLLCFCSWKKDVFSYEDYKQCLKVANAARLSPDYVSVFAAGKFDEELMAEAEHSETLQLVDINTL